MKGRSHILLGERSGYFEEWVAFNKVDGAVKLGGAAPSIRVGWALTFPEKQTFWSHHTRPSGVGTIVFHRDFAFSE